MHLYASLIAALISPSLPYSQDHAQQAQQQLQGLDPSSIEQLLAFEQLHRGHPDCEAAVQQARQQLGKWLPEEAFELDLGPQGSALEGLLSLLLRPEAAPVQALDAQSLKMLPEIGAQLPHRRLAGHAVWTEEEVLALPDSELDLARALLITQFGSDRAEILTYELLMDLMALQIAERLEEHASAREKVDAINQLIFFDKHYRFPPMTVYQEAIDQYTFLPSVVDARRGVCLGVSTLLLCLAQRLDLDLEAVTPPGHIYVQTAGVAPTIRIETTARGIHLPEDAYLGINTPQLQTRSLREVIGMGFFNQASIFTRSQRHEEAIAAYRRAKLYCPRDPLVDELLAYQLILNGEEGEGRQLLSALPKQPPPHELAHDPSSEDYLLGHVDGQGIATLFMPVKEERQSQLDKKAALESVLAKYPLFRSGWLQLGMSWLNLGREKEALAALQEFHQIDSQNPTVEFLLAQLQLRRYNLPAAWQHYETAAALCAARKHEPRELRQLELALRMTGRP